MKRIENFEQHFWAGVDKSGGPDACWPWMRSKVPGGYGQVARTCAGGRHRMAHHVAYELTNGPVPLGQPVWQTCENRACCNPTHCVSGTRAEHMRYLVERGRIRRGEDSPHAKLTYARVEEARTLARTTQLWVLAAEWGVSHQALSAAIRGITWKGCSAPPAKPQRSGTLDFKIAGQMRREYATTAASMTDLARQYKCDIANVSRIINNKVYHDPDYVPPATDKQGRPRKAVA